MTHRSLALCLGVLCVLTDDSARAAEPSPRPNLVVIFTDDHGWADLGAQGVDKHIRTPHLDQLGRDGVLFKRGYVTAPQCTPSRAGLMTGQYQNRFGVEHNGLVMRGEVVTLPERLKAAGYVTGISGKWHLDHENQTAQGGRKNVVHPVISLDIAATGLAAAGLPVPEALDGADLLPYLTGETKAAPHDTLYWRWMSQAAVQEFPWKLIVLGGQENLLFDITTPEGEAADRNLIKQHPEIAARLLAKLEAWTGTLQPPGMPPALADHHVRLFADHGLSSAAPEPAAKASSEPEGSIQGWLCRNGTLAVKDGALTLTPAPGLPKNARPFLTHASLDLAGPVTLTLRLRAQQGGPSTVTWRTRTASFTPEQTAAFDWPAGLGFQEAKLELPEKGRLIHLRITPAKTATGVEIQSIELRSKQGQPQTWRFGNPTPQDRPSI